MERRVLIAVVLSFLVLYGYQTFLAPPPPKPPATTSVQSGSSTVATTPQAPAAVVEDITDAITTETVERQVTVETATVQVVFTNRGGRVLHWRLKQYKDESGKPVDLVPTGIPATEPSPFSLKVDDVAQTRRLNSALYRVSGDAGGRVDATRAQATLTFEFQDAAGLKATKQFTFEPAQYVVRFSARVSASGHDVNPTISWGPGLGDSGVRAAGGSFFTGNAVQPPQAIVRTNNSIDRLAISSLAEKGQRSGEFNFIGIDDHYFLAAAIFPGSTQASFSGLTVATPGAEDRQFVTMALTFAQAPRDVRFFVGPKQFDTLRAIDQDLIRAINFGMFAWLVLPMLSTLKWLYSYVGNYGWSIILLTVIINLIIFPLRHKTVVSMRKMQALQPQLKAIQDRYTGLSMTDPARQKMNTEVMNLYKEKGVNPASGCVPMLLTFPVLFAFYALLSQAIELRGAPFMLWITDLSLRDPYFVTPLLMGASMFWQQKITPSTADPAQQRMMLFMPIIFTGMFLRFPSGLAIYYFTSNLWSIGQQYFTNWWIGPAIVQPARPPAERRLKNAGAGRTSSADKKN